MEWDQCCVFVLFQLRIKLLHLVQRPLVTWKFQRWLKNFEDEKTQSGWSTNRTVMLCLNEQKLEWGRSTQMCPNRFGRKRTCWHMRRENWRTQPILLLHPKTMNTFPAEGCATSQSSEAIHRWLPHLLSSEPTCKKWDDDDIQSKRRNNTNTSNTTT